MKSIALAVLALLVGTVQAQDVGGLLKDADRFRSGAAEASQIDTQIQLLDNDGKVSKERLYRVFSQGQRRSLVLMQSPAEKGQKMLMLGDDFWLLMPGSQRPMRITPMQKLLGDASTGDIATLSWSDDYSGKLVGEEQCDLDKEKRPCLHLSLQAARRSANYQRIELWLGPKHHEPLKAELYVQSDKLAKLASFVLDKPGANGLVTEMRLQDRLSNQRTTVVRYLGRTPKTVPEAWLNPMFLARGTALE